MGNLFSYYTQILFLTLIIINHLWEIYLARRQANYLMKNRFRIPEMFAQDITPDDHQKSTLSLPILVSIQRSRVTLHECFKLHPNR